MITQRFVDEEKKVGMRRETRREMWRDLRCDLQRELRREFLPAFLCDCPDHTN